MKVTFEKFAKAGSGAVNINDLTVICGRNNSGKTYINYAIFSIYKNLVEYFDLDLSEDKLQMIVTDLASKGTAELNFPNFSNDIDKIILNIEEKINKHVGNYFNLPNENFVNTKIKLNLKNMNTDISGNKSGHFSGNAVNLKFSGEKDIKEIQISIDTLEGVKNFKDLDQSVQISKIRYFINMALFLIIFEKERLIPFAITSERTGISLFYKIFDKKSSEIIELTDESSKIMELRSNHAIPIRENIDEIREYENLKNGISLISNEQGFNGILEILSQFLEGGEYISRNNSLFYIPSVDLEYQEPETPLHATSSSLKSLILLDLFIKHIATYKHILIIDEPELNLFPANQALMARLIARLVNIGVKVLVTTHSDYFIREINNLISLGNVERSNVQRDAIMKQYNIEEEEILSGEQVSAYLTTKSQNIVELEINRHGIDSKLLDWIIQKENEKAKSVFELVDSIECMDS